MDLNSLLAPYFTRFLSPAIAAVATYLGFVADPALVPAIGSFVAACILGGISLALAHIHPATVAANAVAAVPATPAK